MVTFVAAPDFETPLDVGGDNVYEVQITVTDGLLSDVQDIAVTVTDVNEAPTITSAAVADAAENQTAVIDVESVDPEGDTESDGLTYGLTGGADQALFTVDSDTGVVTFTAAPDFENPLDVGGNNVYDVQVTVTDSSGLPAGLTDVQDIAVTVTNAGDNAPEITSDGGGATATVAAAENQTAVTDVQSTDPDGETEGSGLGYTFTTAVGGGVDNGLFELDAATGVLSFTAAPDFEDPDDDDTDNDYEIQVTVTDGGGLTDTQDITVTVTDGNDVPTITSAATASVVENQLSAIDVQTADDSSSEGSGLTYTQTTVAGGVDNALFALDPLTGVLTFAVAPDFEAPADDNMDNDYEVQVTVTDGGGLTDTQDITVTVTGGNDAPTMTPASPALAGTNVSTTSAGQPVSVLTAGSTIVDIDPGSTVGIAVTGTTGAGVWQYSVSGTSGPWLAMGGRTDAAARVLLSTAAIRYVATAGTETATITYRAWDTTDLSGNGAAPIATVPNGTATAFSTDSDTASLEVTDPL